MQSEEGEYPGLAVLKQPEKTVGKFLLVFGSIAELRFAPPLHKYND
jgi:hypothetical protein